ncbi:phosphatase domain-containing protein [Nocardioides sp. GY 10127]|uniref:App1 family protein n=1 Tax=Nocardioides sp. GY 10127 TaxID=2569762 RepID=UPI0010A9202C|nr:phosphatase domain-containing protein [Nocardioides sp. GY 10127]TIC84417.1 DUF2183 domain-containing protein [Nocardioides sp. GY 10127]
MTTQPDQPVPLGLPARLEDAVDTVLVGALRRRGWTERVVAFPGYGLEGAWVRLFARVLLAPAPAEPDSSTDETSGVQASTGAAGADGDRQAPRGWRRFTVQSVADVEVTARVGDRTVLLRTNREGYVDARVEVPLPAGPCEVTFCVPGRDPVATTLHVVAAEARLGLVSDLDDTVIVTVLPRRLQALQHAFLSREDSRRPVPGMADLYAELLRGHERPFAVYLSTGAWNVAPAIERFLRRHRYPAGPMLLTDWGPTAGRWFRSGTAHKRNELRRLLADLPHLTWVLVGDDGQHDPETYADLAVEHPDRVAAVLLRDLPPAEAATRSRPGHVLARRRATAAARAAGVPVVHGADGDRLRDRLPGLTALAALRRS